MKNLALVLLGTTLLAAPALAQTAAPNAGAAAPAGTSQPANRQQANDDKAESKKPLYEVRQGQWRSTKLVGLSVYNTNNESIGDISDLIVDRDGKIEAVVIGVGGFLGMGEHSVAVPFEQIKFVNEPRANASAANTTTTGTAGMSGTSAGTTGSSNMTTANNTAAGTNATPNTTGSVASNNAAGSDTMNRSAPDHAMLDMTKDQLKAAPEFKYSR